jgi:hypothetical protein
VALRGARDVVRPMDGKVLSAMGDGMHLCRIDKTPRRYGPWQ